ncbi:MAG: AbgT family transporter [Alphaproteobacteria bacterium]|nr:AbgT family transporter [Alphaproteobacteria bacterium]
MTAEAAPAQNQRTKGILGWIERTGDKLPDPVFIFVYLLAMLMAVSVVGALMGWSAINPSNGDVIRAQSLFTSENLEKLIVQMPQTLTSFAPLGMVLVVMLGAGVAERSGFFSAFMRAGVKDAPKALLTPIVVFMGVMGNQAADAAYVVLIPLAGVLFAAAGRHPIAGIAAAFAGVSGGFSANLLPGQLDALLLGITQPAAQLIDPSYSVNLAGNWWFIAGMAVVFTPLAWFVTDAIIEPRLGRWTPSADAPVDVSSAALTDAERKGLNATFWAFLLITAVWAALAAPQLWAGIDPEHGAPLYNETGVGANGRPEQPLNPFFHSLIAYFFVLFLMCGVLFGAAVKTVRSHHDIVKMMSQAMADLGPYIVLAFMAAHFVVMFNWSNLGAIAAIHGAEGIKTAFGIDGVGAAAGSDRVKVALLLGAVVVLATTVNLVVGSASAKWGFMAPILVPMLMLLGISPEMSTAAYRMGDSITNIVTPLMVYFPLVLTFCQRWDPKFGIGGLMACMIPYSMFFLIFGLTMTIGWVFFNLDLGPGAGVHYTLPTTPAP